MIDSAGDRAGDIEQGTILLVEDDPNDAHLMAVWLQRSETQWNLIHKTTLTDALSALETVVPDLIVSDLGLPDAQGLRAAEALSAAAPDIPLVVLTGATRPELAVAALALGAQDYIHKDQICEDTLRRSINFAVTRHTAHRRLAKLEGSLAIADDELEQYASMVAHDLRAPLRTSRLLSQAISHEITAGGETVEVALNQGLNGVLHRVTDLADRLDVTLGRLDEIVLSMLDYSNVKRTEPNVGPIEIRPTVEEVIDAVEADLDRADATVNIEIEPDLTVNGAATAMWRVIENLVSNSIKFRCPDRPLEITVSAAVEASGRTVRVAVRDNGIGIPASEADRVFLPLERLDTSGEGSGFGLAICRRHLTAMGGEIWLDARDDTHGSTIMFELPRV